MRADNLIGKRFGKLFVVARAENSKQGKAMWLCICDCGKKKESPVLGYDLKHGKVQSCGCAYVESNKGRNAKHGKSKTRVYTEWCSMNRRCEASNSRAYPNYAARGISVCDEWRSSFQAFYDWAMKSGYSDELTLDRIDTDKGYSPKNCRWATMREQQNNRRNNRTITYQGNKYTLAELARLLGVPYATLGWRIDNGWNEGELNIAPSYKNKSIRKRI